MGDSVRHFLVLPFPGKPPNGHLPQSSPDKDMARWMVKEGNEEYKLSSREQL